MKKFSFTWKGSHNYTRREELYFKCLENLDFNFNNCKVLEIGPGTGDFAHEFIIKYNPKTYNILDVRRQISDSQKKLQSIVDKCEINFYTAEEYWDVFDIDFDFIVSNICIPETPKEYREILLDNIVPRSKAAMIIGQLSGFGDDEYEDYIKKLFKLNYKTIKCIKTDYCNCYALIGY